MTVEQLGRARQVRVTADRTAIIGGAGDAEQVEFRVAQLRAELERATFGIDEEVLSERIGVAVRQGRRDQGRRPTNAELAELQHRVEDALSATRAAMAEGIVAGGGVALMHAAPVLDELDVKDDYAIGVEIVRRALTEPTYLIATNAGYPGHEVVAKVAKLGVDEGFDALEGRYGNMIDMGIIDPLRVCRSALQNGASVAGLLLTTNTLIAEEQTPWGGSRSLMTEFGPLDEGLHQPSPDSSTPQSLGLGPSVGLTPPMTAREAPRTAGRRTTARVDSASLLRTCVESFEDLQMVLRCCERLVTELGPGLHARPRGGRGGLDDGPALLRPLLRPAGHGRGARRGRRDHRAAGQPTCWSGTRSCCGCGSTTPTRANNPRERFTVGVTQDADGAAERRGDHLGAAAPGRRGDGAPDRRDRLRPQRPRQRPHRGRSRRSSSSELRDRVPGRPRRARPARRGAPASTGVYRRGQGRRMFQSKPAFVSVAFVRGPLPLLGPAFVAAIAYIDPGNFATNITAGSQLRLPAGLGRGGQQPDGDADPVPLRQGRHRHRQEPRRAVPRHTSRKPVTRGLWVQAELVAIATDLAEVLGGAIALQLLFGLPLLVGGVITAVVAFGLLGLQHRGARPFEVAITGMLLVVLVGLPVQPACGAGSTRARRVAGLVPQLRRHGQPARWPPACWARP